MRRAVWLFLPLVAAAMVAPAPAVAAESSRVLGHSNVHGVDVQAFFRSVSGETEEGWFETYVYADGALLNPGASPAAPEAAPWGGVTLEMDWVTVDGDSWSIWVAFCYPSGNTPGDHNLPPGYLDLDASLKSASLHGDFSCVGSGSYPSQVSVDLTWTVPPGTLSAGGSTYRYREPGHFANVVFQDAIYWDAEVVGTVSDGTTNFTPSPAEYGITRRYGTEQIVLQMG